MKKNSFILKTIGRAKLFRNYSLAFFYGWKIITGKEDCQWTINSTFFTGAAAELRRDKFQKEFDDLVRKYKIIENESAQELTGAGIKSMSAQELPPRATVFENLGGESFCIKCNLSLREAINILSNK